MLCGRNHAVLGAMPAGFANLYIICARHPALHGHCANMCNTPPSPHRGLCTNMCISREHSTKYTPHQAQLPLASAQKFFPSTPASLPANVGLAYSAHPAPPSDHKDATRSGSHAL